MKGLASALLAGAALLAAPATAEEMDAEAAEIVVKGQLVKADEAAYSTTTLDNADIRKESVSDFDELLKFIPGMAVRDLGLGGVANSIVIRGFGGGGHGGDLGAVIDGVPLNEAMSHADGYIDLNVLVPLEVETLTVYRGPVSALYGNYNRGGLLRIDTRKTGDYVNADIGGGSFETLDVQLAAGQRWAGGQFNAAAQIYTTDGYRPQSSLLRQTVSARLGFDLAESVELSIAGRYHHSEADSASYLTQAQFDTDPYGIDPNAQRDGANKNFANGRADLSIALSPSVSLVSFAYLTGQDFTRWFSRPVSTTAWRQREESYERKVFGAGSSLNGEIDAGWLSSPVTFAAGVEMFRERTDYLFFDGLNNRIRTGPAANDRETRLNSVSGFAEAQVPFSPLFDVSLGLRADRFTGGCKLLGPETGSDPCGDLDTTSQLSPKAGARSQVSPWLQLRASWSQGFALANNFVKYAVGGQALEPNVFRQTELGLTLTPLSGMKLDVAAFRLGSAQEVRTVAPGIYENFGKTRRQGVEASAEWQATPSLWLRGVYGYVETEVRENADTSLIGKSVAGVPAHTANVDATWSPIRDWSLSANWRYVGSYQVNAANTLQSEAYDTLDLSIAYDGTAGSLGYQVYGRVDNVTDAIYATSVSQIGGQTVLAPGAPRTFRAGVKVTL
ncbi:MAG TPA: TonB-dependent receptor [Croceibacterium sp.]|nr:TonB-dependent receptor [Croceibacterium sp.]